jgi:acetyl esterase/lipase
VQRRVLLAASAALGLDICSGASAAATDEGALPADTRLLDQRNSIAVDVPYLGSDRAERADLYLPAQRKARAPAVVVIHGGGYNAGDKADPKVKEIASFLAGIGYVVLSINYQLDTPHSREPPYPRNLMDCKMAVRWLRANADKFSLDSGEIAALGMSAGATLAAMLAVTSGVKELEPVSPFSGISTAVQAAILFYPPMGDRHSNKFSFGYGRKAPVTYLRPGLPPVLLLQGAKDKLVSAKDTKEVAVDFTRSGVENQLVIVAEEGHGFGLSPNSPLRPVVQTFLAEHLIHKL